MKLSLKEYDAMQSGWRKWVNEHMEIAGFKAWGMDIGGKDILEVGCGSGYSASLIVKDHPRLLAAAEGQALHQRRGALQGLDTLGVAEDAGHPGARTAVDADRLSHRRAGGGGTEYADLTEDVQ